MFSSRTRWNFQVNALSQRLAQLRAQNIPILDLTQSNPTACGIETPAEILDALQDPRNLRYEPSALGNDAAREAVAVTYAESGRQVDPGNIVLTASTSEAYSFCLRLLAEPDDAVLFPRPSYPLLDHLAQINDVRVERYFLRHEKSWHMDLGPLEETLRKNPRIRAVAVVNPNNPTGSYLKKNEWADLQKICAVCKTAIISDEVFADYALAPGEDRITSVAGDAECLTFALGGISKMLGLPQMKLAWICVGGPQAQRKEALARLEMLSDTYLSVNTPAQNALPVWLKHKREIQAGIQKRLLTNWAALEKHPWKNAGCDLLPAEGGWYAVLRIPAVQTEEQWVLQILEKKHVLVHPGFFFDFEQEAYLVISLLPPPDTFAQAVDGIWACVS